MDIYKYHRKRHAGQITQIVGDVVYTGPIPSKLGYLNKIFEHIGAFINQSNKLSISSKNVSRRSSGSLNSITK